MVNISNRVLIAGGIAGAAVIVGYCIYFDRKRRSDPDYKKKIRERRLQKALNKPKKESTERSTELPSFTSPNEAQAFFLQEVQLGEELLSEGDNENAVEHLYNAVRMCGAPSQLLQVLHQTLPPAAYSLLMQRLASTREVPPARIAQPGDAAGVVVDEDLE